MNEIILNTCRSFKYYHAFCVLLKKPSINEYKEQFITWILEVFELQDNAYKKQDVYNGTVLR